MGSLPGHSSAAHCSSVSAIAPSENLENAQPTQSPFGKGALVAFTGTERGCWPGSGVRPSRTWGCYVPGRGIWAGDAMRWRITLELAGADDTRQLHELGAGERSPSGHTAATLGVGLAEGKALLAALQRHLVAAQVDEHCRNRRRCNRCGAQRPLKDLRPRRLASLFGVVAVRAPRFGPCRCGVACPRG